MTRLTRGDGDLHAADGSHRATARTSSGADIERTEARLRAHLAEHARMRREIPDEQEAGMAATKRAAASKAAVDNGQGDPWVPGSRRYEARQALERAVEAFCDEAEARFDALPVELRERFGELMDALERWRVLGRDGE